MTPACVWGEHGTCNHHMGRQNCEGENKNECSRDPWNQDTEVRAGGSPKNKKNMRSLDVANKGNHTVRRAKVFIKTRVS